MDIKERKCSRCKLLFKFVGFSCCKSCLVNMRRRRKTAKERIKSGKRFKLLIKDEWDNTLDYEPSFKRISNPTSFSPGSEGKIQVLIKRYSVGEPLFQGGDETDQVFGYHSNGRSKQ